MHPISETQLARLRQGETRPMAQKIAIGSFLLGAVFLVAATIVGVLAA